MAGLSGVRRITVGVAAVLAGVGAIALITVAVLKDLETADRVASIVGAVAALIGLVVAILALNGTLGRGGHSAQGRRVRASRGGIAVGGDMVGNAVGDQSEVIGPVSPPRAGASRSRQDDVRAGRDGLATGGDLRDNALGDNSKRRRS